MQTVELPRKDMWTQEQERPLQRFRLLYIRTRRSAAAIKRTRDQVNNPSRYIIYLPLSGNS